MVKVLYDYQHFSEQRYGGITRYFANIISEIHHTADIECEVATLYTNNYYIKDIPLPFKSGLVKKLLSKKNKREIKWNRAYSKYLIKRGNYDVFHPTYYHPYFLPYIKKPFVVTVHDMIHERFPEAFLTDDIVSGYKRHVVVKADKVIAISNSTKNDLIELLNIPEDRIEVIYHGVNIKEFSPVKVPRTLDIPDSFILYVGSRDIYKNFNRLAEALVPIFRQHDNMYLVCTGGMPFSKADIKFLTDIDIIHRCIRLSVTDDELTELYQHAKAFVFPSLYEGFGFPILEAFQNSCPVLCSNTSSFPEVGGDAVKYFDPENVNDISDAVLSVLVDDELKNSLVEAGKKRLQLFPLQKCIDKTISLYHQLAGR
ncbi:glycosyltransferase family 4 protein [Mucilaginibacter agri]|uniref:Glycosyltransferase n=1 Tax=Mucilaginibacter agri TaxID=2695265 RepID=A0A965ZIN6_9SPHI|nr:glycosyltransferase family 1 protein [Mucilaginibacter agri]NCD70356.1 glycosyltransferase [Mucilaginibacter agri]